MKINEAYNQWAAQYDTNQNKTRDLDQKATIKTLESYSFDTVLELGCGTGKNTAWLLSKAKQIVAIDFSEEMLNKAKVKITDDRVLFQSDDLNKAWHVASDYFDLITCSLTMEHIKDMDSIFAQAYKKLKPNGLFFISELHPIKQYLGSKARFETNEGVVSLEVFTHHISDFIANAENNNFKLLELKEWFDDGFQEYPRLVSFIFQKEIK